MSVTISRCKCQHKVLAKARDGMSSGKASLDMQTNRKVGRKGGASTGAQKQKEIHELQRKPGVHPRSHTGDEKTEVKVRHGGARL